MRISRRRMAGWIKRLPHFHQFVLQPGPFQMSGADWLRLARTPGLTPMTTSVLGHRIEIADPFWYLHSYRELLLDEIYRFESARPDPYIIDCGANIGLSVIFFKHLYPAAKIVAFEPDIEIFAALKHNVHAFGFTDVSLIQKAVWCQEGRLNFSPDGSVGGRLGRSGAEGPQIEVTTARLRDYLQEEIDFLKIDIEGAEDQVLLDCADSLHNVRKLFVEYHSEPGKPQALATLLEIMRSAGMRYHIQDANPIRHPYRQAERNACFDLQLNVFAYRDSE